MHVQLHGLSLALISSDPHLRTAWEATFDLERHAQAASVPGVSPDVIVEGVVVSHLPPPPPGQANFYAEELRLAVFSGAGEQYVLHWHGRAQAIVRLTTPNPAGNLEPATVRLAMTAAAVHQGVLEDVTTTALAPILRRRGYFMIHACAVADRNRAVMMVGPSGSGKTTVGLALFAAGWQFLANDVALMARSPSSIDALLSPGTVNIAPQTIHLLPSLRAILGNRPSPGGYAKVSVRRGELIGGAAHRTAFPLDAIYFPHIREQEDHALEPIPHALGVARLMEASMDRWDQPTWPEHLAFLETLGGQVSFRELFVGRRLDKLPLLLGHDTGLPA